MNEKIILAIVAAVSAVGGAFLTQVFSLIRESRISMRENRALLREKYELLADQVVESVAHKDKFGSHCDDEIFSDFLNKPIEKIFCLSLLYFPELFEVSKDYYNAYRDYCLVLYRNYIPGTGLSAVMQAVNAADVDLDAVVDNLNKAQKSVYDRIRENASKYARV